MDRIAQISVFVAAIDAGSLVAAGKRFGLSPSMAGKYLSALEADLKVRLIHRSTRSLNLTDAGRTYYVRCKRLLEEFDDANREVSDAQSTLRGSLRVAAPVTFGALHLGEVAARFLGDFPQVNLDVSLDDRYVDLQNAGVDVAVRIGCLPDSDLIARRLGPCRMVLCAAQALLQRMGTPRHPRDLDGAPRLAFNAAVSAGEWILTDKRKRQHVIDGPLRMQADNMQMLRSAALAGLGIAYGPTFVFGTDLEAGKLVPLLPEYRTLELSIHAVYPTARYVPSKVRRFIDYLVEAFDNDPPWDRFLEAAGTQ